MAQSKPVTIPVICETPNCPNHHQLVNAVSEIAVMDLDLFYEGDHGCDPADYCPACGNLGTALDPKHPD